MFLCSNLTLSLERPTSQKVIIDTLEAKSKTSLRSVLNAEYDELVSCNFQGNPYSAVVDAKACLELNSTVGCYAKYLPVLYS